MPDHIQPTKEELEEQNRKILEQEETPPQPNPDPANPNPSADGEDSGQPEPSEELEETPPAKSEGEPTPPTENFEKRYQDSSREAHILAEAKKKLEQEIDEAQNIPVPTDEEVKTEYPEWDEMSDTEKKLARKTTHQEKINTKIKEIRDKQKADESQVQERTKEIELFTINPDILKRFPKLEGRQAEFIAFAIKPSRITLDLEDLTKLFILDLPEPKKNKGQMLESGVGGPNDHPKPKGNKITIDQAATLKQNDYKKYLEYLKAGRIETEVE